jgi:imidazole glycerol-phosphate synthase subunit HisH
MIAIIDYKAGNLTSVKRALDYLGIACEITGDPARVLNAERIIFPGVGHAGTARAALAAAGLDKVLLEAFSAGKPILGICLGCQIVLSRSEEGDTPGLDLIKGRCRKFVLQDPALKIPHMGWDALAIVQPHPLLKDVGPKDEFYFVHSFYPEPAESTAVYATCDYGISFAAAIGFKSLFATQFHPEKSGQLGLSILRRFAGWDGRPC